VVGGDYRAMFPGVRRHDYFRARAPQAASLVRLFGTYLSGAQVRFAAHVVATLFVAFIIYAGCTALAKFGELYSPPECHRPCCFSRPPLKAAPPRPVPVFPPTLKD
jgi:hypothetical protein